MSFRFNKKEEQDAAETGNIQELLNQNNLLQGLLGGEGQNIFDEIMKNENFMNSILNSEAFQKDLMESTKDKTDFLDIFQTVVKEVIEKPHILDMVTKSAETLQTEMQTDENLQKSVSQLNINNGGILQTLSQTLSANMKPQKEEITLHLQVIASKDTKGEQFKIRSNFKKLGFIQYKNNTLQRLSEEAAKKDDSTQEALGNFVSSGSVEKVQKKITQKIAGDICCALNLPRNMDNVEIKINIDIIDADSRKFISSIFENSQDTPISNQDLVIEMSSSDDQSQIKLRVGQNYLEEQLDD